MEKYNYKKIVILILMIAMIGGCASFDNYIPPWRKPGEKLLDLHEKVWQDYNCQNEKLPVVKIEHNELIPQRLNPKKEMECNHRLVYGLCSDKSGSEIVGRLYTRIYYQGRIVVNDIDEDYSLKPGRWRVDTFIQLPEKIESGVYTLEIEFTGPTAGFKVDNTFIVESREKSTAPQDEQDPQTQNIQ